MSRNGECCEPKIWYRAWFQPTVVLMPSSAFSQSLRLLQRSHLDPGHSFRRASPWTLCRRYVPLVADPRRAELTRTLAHVSSAYSSCVSRRLLSLSLGRFASSSLQPQPASNFQGRHSHRPRRPVRLPQRLRFVLPVRPRRRYRPPGAPRQSHRWRRLPSLMS